MLRPPTPARNAARRGIVVNTIQCGDNPSTRNAWLNVAQNGNGEYFAIAQDGGVEVLVTPYDQELAQLGEQMGATYMAYGATDKRRASQSAQIAMESRVVAAAPAAAKADRALNKALNARAYDESDLVQQAGSRHGGLAKNCRRRTAGHPAQPAAWLQRQAALDKAVGQRKELRERIVVLSKKREQYLAQQRSERSSKGAFDAAVSAAPRKTNQVIAQSGSDLNSATSCGIEV
ncbi:hypothetical protein LP420_21275 [Massilia sp. B-10]|nr:hypothetical protein LP420_21275 [Massilia sp. B-10]